jgi:hypothetical protein
LYLLFFFITFYDYLERETMPYSQVEPQRLHVQTLSQRKSKSSITDIAIDPESEAKSAGDLDATVTATAQLIKQARKNNASVMLAYGAHLVKNGIAPILVRLMEQGWLTHLATQGAGTIHDWEFSYWGKSEEDVRANVATGTFGVWEETSKYINLAVLLGAMKGMGYGESLGELIHNEALEVPTPELVKQTITDFLHKGDPAIAPWSEWQAAAQKFNLSPGRQSVPHPFKAYSILGHAYRLRVPFTVHPGIGYDIIYNTPYANGAAIGRASHTDYKIFVDSVSRLSGGVFLSVGSAIMAPQVFEKAMSFANNLLLPTGRKITDHTIVVNDLQPMTWDWQQGEPPKSSPDYYLRFLKSFTRMGGAMHYVAMDNRHFLHLLYKKLQS